MLWHILLLYYINGTAASWTGWAERFLHVLFEPYHWLTSSIIICSASDVWVHIHTHTQENSYYMAACVSVLMFGLKGNKKSFCALNFSQFSQAIVYPTRQQQQQQQQLQDGELSLGLTGWYSRIRSTVHKERGQRKKEANVKVMGKGIKTHSLLLV